MTLNSQPHAAPSFRSDVDFPSADTPAIASHRRHNESEVVAPFGADSWPLAALDDKTQRSSTIHFNKWPSGFQLFARHVAYVLINYGTPETLREAAGAKAAQWPNGSTIEGWLSSLRIQVDWLVGEWSASNPATPVQAPIDLDSFHLDDLRSWAEQRQVGARSKARSMATVILIWHLNPWLPDEAQWPEPAWMDQKWQPRRSREENKTVPISEATFAPLLEWAIAFVSNFAPDIIAAHQHYTDRTSSIPAGGGYAAAAAILAQYVDNDIPLPPKTEESGGRYGHGIGWPVMEYRHGLPMLAFSTMRRRVEGNLNIGEDAALTALDLPITGIFNRRAWIDWIGVFDVSYVGRGTKANSAGYLIGHLRTACLIVIAGLTGMRPDEVLRLRSGCAPEPIIRPGGSRLQLIHGHVSKGVKRKEDGSAGDPRKATWATIPQAAIAVHVVEKVNQVLHREGGFLFIEQGTAPVATATATKWIEEFIGFVNKRLAPLTETPSAFTISSDPDGLVTLRRFRRTLAWFVRNRQHGEVAAAIQYQHFGVVMGEGYAGTKSSGMPDLLLEEDWKHRLAMIRQLRELLAAGGGVGGPAAERAIEATRRLPRSLTPGDERRLRKDKSIVIYDNPTAIALCLYREAEAGCKKIKLAGMDSQPDLLECVDGCSCLARTDSHVQQLRFSSIAMRAQAEISPLPIAQSMLAQADRNLRLAEEFESSRLTLDNNQAIPSTSAMDAVP